VFYTSIAPYIFPAIKPKKIKIKNFLQVIIGFDFQQAQRRADHAQRCSDDRQESDRARRRHASPHDVTQRHATWRMPCPRVQQMRTGEKSRKRLISG
jgi:hypothetical protein